jgi:hypothetical protein
VKRQILFCAVASALLLLLPGCDWFGDEEPPPPTETGEPSPTGKQIAAEIEVGLQRLEGITSFEEPLTEELRDELLTHLRTAKRKHQKSEWGREGLMLVANGLEDRLDVAREDMVTDLVLFLCDMIEILEPDNSKLERFREWSQIHRNRPQVTILGWFEFMNPKVGDEELYVSLKVGLPETGKVERVKVQEGEEFLGLKFQRIIGKKRGILLEYEATGDRFGVYGPGRRSRTLYGETRMR